mmetsp:Transcript_23197/g.59172  ORF Transcript_23197/g.59172 Transcript_23197/m.59172 type:complete len:220 (+) Transcript_23197:2344-3003(+)
MAGPTGRGARSNAACHRGGRGSRCAEQSAADGHYVVGGEQRAACAGPGGGAEMAAAQVALGGSPGKARALGGGTTRAAGCAHSARREEGLTPGGADLLWGVTSQRSDPSPRQRCDVWHTPVSADAGSARSQVCKVLSDIALVPEGPLDASRRENASLPRVHYFIPAFRYHFDLISTSMMLRTNVKQRFELGHCSVAYISTLSSRVPCPLRVCVTATRNH